MCTYGLNCARRTSWGWWDDWDDTVPQTQDSKFEPWRSEAEHATSRSRRFHTILTFTRGWGRNIFCFFQTTETGNRTPNSGVKGRGANHYPRAPALQSKSAGLALLLWSHAPCFKYNAADWPVDFSPAKVKRSVKVDLDRLDKPEPLVPTGRDCSGHRMYLA